MLSPQIKIWACNGNTSPRPPPLGGYLPNFISEGINEMRIATGANIKYSLLIIPLLEGVKGEVRIK